MFFRREPEPDDYPPAPPDRSWPTRLAWCVLVGGAALLVLRCSFATVVEIHGDGMVPNLRSGDHVLFVRGTWGLDRGDLVVYDPTPPEPEPEPAPAPAPEIPGERPAPDSRPRAPGSRDRLRNTAVVDAKDLGLDDEWEKVQRRSGVASRPPSRSLRVARILALPGDTVTFGDARGALGLAINGEPIAHKPGLGEASGRPTSFEHIGDRRYQVLASTAGRDLWPALGVPADGSPYEMTADGYLLVADNRDEGACCDSRAIGWIDASQIRGEIMLRLGGAEDPPR